MINETNMIYDLFDLNKYGISRNQFKNGVNVELEHGSINNFTNITNDDIVATSKIAIAHLLESPDYYKYLKKMEKLMDESKKKAHKSKNS